MLNINSPDALVVNLLLTKVVDQRHNVTHRPSKTVKSPDDERVARLQSTQVLCQAAAFCLCPEDFVSEYVVDRNAEAY